MRRYVYTPLQQQLLTVAIQISRPQANLELANIQHRPRQHRRNASSSPQRQCLYPPTISLLLHREHTALLNQHRKRSDRILAGLARPYIQQGSNNRYKTRTDYRSLYARRASPSCYGRSDKITSVDPSSDTSYLLCGRYHDP